MMCTWHRTEVNLVYTRCANSIAWVSCIEWMRAPLNDERGVTTLLEGCIGVLVKECAYSIPYEKQWIDDIKKVRVFVPHAAVNGVAILGTSSSQHRQYRICRAVIGGSFRGTWTPCINVS